MLAAIKEKGWSRMRNVSDRVITLRSKLWNVRSKVLNWHSVLLNVRSELWNEDFIRILGFFHPIEEESESPCKENPFGIHRQKKAGVSLNLSMLFPSEGLKRFEIGIVVKTIK